MVVKTKKSKVQVGPGYARTPGYYGSPTGYYLDEVQVASNLCKRSFSHFCQEFWEEIHPDERLVWGWHNDYMCRTKQRAAERVFLGLPKLYDLIFNVPPGTTKSTVESIMFPPWTWTRMASARHICASHTEQLVHDLARYSRDVVQSPKYQEYFPGINLREDQRTKGYYMNSRGGFRLSVTVGGKTPTGFHSHFLSVDDAIDPKKAISLSEVKTANYFMTNVLSTRKVNRDVTLTTLVMQRLSQDDPSGNWLRRAMSEPDVRIKHVCLPAELTPLVKPTALRKKYVDGLLDPVRLSRRALAEEKAKGNFLYSGQFLQDPIPEGGLMFDTRQLITGLLPPPDNKFKRIIRGWDNSSNTGDGDYTAGVKVGITRDDPPRVWVLHVHRGQWNTNMRERQKDKMAEFDGRGTEIAQEQEPGSGGKDTATMTTIRLGLMGFKVITTKPTGDKELRADPFSVQVNAGNVYLAPGAWNHDYIEELKYFPHGMYDDQVDGTSVAYNDLVQPRKRVGCF